jgi:N2,N2-dimethylguanosine tRNA methyltransferase
MLQMPPEFYGETGKSGGFTHSDPRRWTEDELNWVSERIAEGHTMEEIAKAIGRTQVSVSIKMKRQKKRDDTYNEKTRQIKYLANQKFLEETKPKSVLDLFAGNSYYSDKNIKQLVTNDKDHKFPTGYHMDALMLLCHLYSVDATFDVIDLDPYGSAYDCLDLAVKMAKKGIAISFGEWGHKRWKRYDYVRNRYNITCADEFTEQAFIDEIARVAANNKKSIKTINVIKYGNFLRVYCTFDRLKITEQWEQE